MRRHERIQSGPGAIRTCHSPIRREINLSVLAMAEFFVLVDRFQLERFRSAPGVPLLPAVCVTETAAQNAGNA